MRETRIPILIHLIKDTLTVTAKDKITVPLASDGGAAMHIQPVSF